MQVIEITSSGVLLKDGIIYKVNEDFSILNKADENLKKVLYEVFYYPLYRINEQGVKTFSKMYEVFLRRNGIEERIGNVKIGYKIIRSVDTLKEIESKDFIEKIYLMSLNRERVDFKIETINDNREVVLDIIPYEEITGSKLYTPSITEKIGKEILKTNLFNLRNSYAGEFSLSMFAMIERMICGNNQFFERRFVEKIKHIGKKLKLSFQKVLKISEIIKQLEGKGKEIMNIEVDKNDLEEVRIYLKYRKVKEEIYKAYLKEVNLINQARDRILLWDYINVLTALSSHKLTKEKGLKYLFIRNWINNKSTELLFKLMKKLGISTHFEN